MTRERMEALRYPNEDVAVVTRLVELHLRFHTYPLGWTDKAVRRYVRDAGPLLDRLNELTRCDCTTRNAAKARALGAADGRARASASPSCASRRSSTRIRPELDGNRVMELLGVAAGTGRRASPRLPARAPASTRARSARRRPPAAARVVGRPSRD